MKIKMNFTLEGGTAEFEVPKEIYERELATGFQQSKDDLVVMLTDEGVDNVNLTSFNVEVIEE